MAEIKKTATSETGHQVTGKVAILYGTVKAISPDGTVRLLKLNSPVYADDRIITGDDGSVSIVFNTYPPMQLDLGRVSEVVIDEDVYGAVTPDVSAEASAEQKAIQEALLAGDQPIEVDATAAGAESSSGGGHPTFVVNADWSAVTPESGAETTGIKWGTPETQLYTALNPENSIPTITVDTGEGGGNDGGNDGTDPGSGNGTGTGTGTGNSGSNVIGGNDTVYEAGLPGGSDGSATTTAGGTFIISDPDGLDDIVSITINGTTIPITDVVGAEINGTYGTLTITGYDSTTGTGTYTYELTSPTIDGPGTETDIFNISTTDQSGATSDPAAITIEIADDLPNAVDDGQSIMEDDTAALTGNVFDNDVHPNGERGADAPVVFDEWTGDTTAQYGTFTANPDGSYVYTLDPDNGLVQGLNEGETLTETFTYQIVDADGDVDTATLTITIVGTNETPVINVDPGNGGADDVVYESGLTNGSAAAADTEYATGTFTLSDPDGLGDIQSVTINGTTIAISNLAGSVINGVNGTLTVTDYNAATGVANYTYQLTSPTTDGPGPETEVFTLSVSDESGSSEPAALTIEIIDDVPTAYGDSGTATEGETLTVSQANGVLANDVIGADAGGSVVTTGTFTGTYGTLTLNADGSYSYAANGAVPAGSEDTFNYTMQDADGDQSQATLTINFSGDNNAPTANDDAKDVNESGLRDGGTADVSGTVSFSAGLDTPATITGYDDTSLQHGTVTFDTTTGAWTYTLSGPVTDAAGAETDSFTYTVTDSDGTTSTGTITITIIDDVPTAYGDSGTATEGETLTVSQANGVLANDVIGADAGGSVVTTGTFTGTYGTLTLNADGSYSYAANGAVPAGSEDTFNYTMQDADGDQSQATLTINFSGDNNAPTANDDAKDVNESGLRDGGTADVSGTVSFSAGLDTPATITGYDDTSLQHGTVTFDTTTGAWTYTLSGPVTDAAGAETDSFTYTVTDSDGTTSTGTITITIIDDVPTAYGDSGTATEGETLTVSQANGVLANDVIGADAGGSVVTTGTFTGTYGTLTLNADGSYSYAANGAVPAGSEDTFNYTMQDADGDQSQATLTINFSGDNNAPTANDDAKDVNESGLRDGGTADVSGTVSFSAGLDTPATITGYDDTSLQHGTVTFDTTTGAWTYTLSGPVTDAAGAETDSFTYTVTDSDGTTSTGTITITIIDDVPTAYGDSGTATEGETLTVSQANGVLANDVIGADAGGSVVTTGTFTGTYGTLTLNADGSYSYAAKGAVPAGSEDTFNYTMQDADGDQSQATLTINFSGDNNAPTANDDAKDVNESGLRDGGTADVSGTVSFSAGLDTPATITGYDDTSLQHGTVTFDTTTGAWTYTLSGPVTDAAGAETDSFTYTVTDSDGTTSTGTITITIIDDVPTAYGDSGTATEGETLTVSQANGVLANDVIGADAGGSVVTTGTFTGTYGTLTLNADGSYSYAANGAVPAGSEDTFNYTMQDADGDQSQATLTINFSGDNNAPTANDDAKDVNESGLRDGGTADVSGTVSFSAGLDTPATITGYDDTSLQHGTVTFDTTTGAWTYTLSGPVTDAAGAETDSFTYTVTDSDGTTSTGTITITIIDDVPTAYGDSGTATEGETLTVSQANGVLANDVIGADAGGSVVTTGTFTGTYGTLTLNADGSYSYAANGAVPAGSEDTFNYTMQDADGDQSQATLTINFSGDNNAPTANDDAKDVNESGLRDGGTADVSGTVSFSAGLDTPATITGYDDTSLQHGTVTFDTTTGAWTYTLSGPVTDAAGAETDSFTYTVTDSDGTTSTGTITITIIDDVPTAYGDSGTATEGETLTVSQANGVLANDTVGADAGGSVVTTGTFTGTYGTLTLNADGSYSYAAKGAVPAGSEDTFNYTMQDADGDQSQATLTINFSGDNNAPTANDDAKDVNESDLRDGGTADVSGTVSFSAGLDIPATITGYDVTSLQHGTVTFDTTTGAWTYTLSGPVTDAAGAETDSFTYTVTDSDGTTSTGTITITIIDDVPTAYGDSGTATEGETLTVSQANGVLANDTVGADAGGSVVTTGTFTGTYGTLTLNADGSYSYAAKGAVPAGSEDTFNYTMQDADGDQSQATLTINFSGDNNAPTANDDAKDVNESDLRDGGTADVSGTVSFSAGLDTPATITGYDDTSLQHGTVTFDTTTGAWTYTLSGPVTDAAGAETDSFTYTVTDSDGTTSTGTITITIIDDVPTAYGDSGTATEGETLTVSQANGVLANDTVGADAGGSVVTTGTFTGTYGTLTLNADGSYSYAAKGAVPAGSEDTFNYTMQDADGDQSQATLTINFSGDNNAPTANDDAKDVNESDLRDGGTADVSGTVSFSAGLDIPATITGYDVTSLQHGTVTFDTTTGAWTYTLSGPVTDAAGAETDSFTYTVTDSDGTTSTGTITITIIDDVPTAYGDSGTATEGETLTVSQANGVLANDTVGADAGGSVVTTGTFTGTYGTLTLNADGSYSYAAKGAVPAGSEDTFNYTMQDADGDQSQATLTINFSGDNNAPTANDDAKDVNESDLRDGGTADVSGTVSFSAGLDIPATITGYDVTSLQHGTVTFDTTTGAWTYTLSGPVTDAAGAETDSFTYTVTDSDGTTSTGTITITIIDDVPTAYGDSGTATEGETLTVSQANGVLANDTVGADAGGSVVTTGTFTGTYGTLTLNADGSYSYAAKGAVPAGSEDTFNYTMQDADGDQSQATLTINVTPDPADLVVASAMDDGATSDAPYVYGEPGPGIINGSSGNNIMIADPWPNSHVAPGDIVSLVLVLDSSGSMDANITFNGVTMTRMEALQISVKQMLDGLAGSQASKITVTLVDFDRTATNLGTFVIQGGTDTNDAAQLTAAKNQVDTLKASGGTNYEAGLQAAHTWINTTTADDDATIKKVLFVSDGNPTYYVTSSGGVGGDGQEGTSNINTSMNQVLGSDGTNEVTLIEGTGYTIESVGIAITNSASIERLNNIEDGNASGGDGHTDIITTGEALSQVIGEISGSTSTKVLGSDEIHSGDGNDIIFGDVPFTDALADEHGLGSTIADGSGWKVFQELGWAEQQMVDYIKANQSTLSAESGLTGGNDTIDAGAGNDIVYGQDGNDTINGGAGDDILSGGSGNDILVGGPGNDTLTGGTGTDTFTVGEGNDIIKDFTGEDTIDITAVLDMSDEAAHGFLEYDSTTKMLKIFDNASDHSDAHLKGSVTLEGYTGDLNALLGHIDHDGTT